MEDGIERMMSPELYNINFLNEKKEKEKKETIIIEEKKETIIIEVNKDTSIHPQ